MQKFGLTLCIGYDEKQLFFMEILTLQGSYSFFFLSSDEICQPIQYKLLVIYPEPKPDNYYESNSSLFEIHQNLLKITTIITCGLTLGVNRPFIGDLFYIALV